MRTATVASILLLMLSAASSSAASESVFATVTVTATFGTRTALDVSTQLLRFDGVQPGRPATAAVYFAAKARTVSGGEVVLTVEPLRAGDGPGGAADVETAVTFEGHGDGTLDGRLAAARPAVAARWVGSGRRNGRLVFALRAGARGDYSLPVRFVLTAP